MTPLLRFMKELLWEQQPTTEVEAVSLLSGITGRGQGGYNTKLKEWLESAPSVFPERILVEDIDHPQDNGIDVIVTGLSTKVRIGFQVKSDNDLKEKDFSQKLKAQITDASSRAISLIVIVFACTPNQKNKQRYKYIQNHFAGYLREDILILDPYRAAGLLKVFNAPLKAPVLGAGSWENFFEATGHREYIWQYLDIWPGIAPDQRFTPPHDFDKWAGFIPDSPVKVLIGPPGTGKTFVALQLLWKEFRAGRGIRWISPHDLNLSDGPVSGEDARSEFRQRIDVLSRTLGIDPKSPPLDSNEFIAKNLRPDTTVYIEDPFGKTDKEFEASLHTCSFFDLNAFTSSIKASASRAGCRLLISSREGLFDRWVDDLKANSKPLPDLEIIKIGSSSYDLSQLLKLAEKLGRAKGLADPKEYAKHIATDAELPYEVEMLIRDLPENADIKDVISTVHAAKGDLKVRARKKIIPENDSERLFILLTAALSTRGMLRNDFETAFCMLHSALGLGGDAKEALLVSLGRFRSSVTVMGVGGSSHMHIEPAHSTVSEAIDECLLETSQEWLRSVALALSSPADAETHAVTLSVIGIHLMSLGVGVDDGPEQNSLIKVLFGYKGLSFLHHVELLKIYTRLSQTFKSRLFEYLQSNESVQLPDFLSVMSSFGIPAADGFDAVRHLFSDPRLGGGRSLIFGNPWGYLFKHLQTGAIPSDISQKLDAIAKNEPALFSFGLGLGVIEYWETVPVLWREALLSPASIDNPAVQKQILLPIAMKIQSVAEPLKTLLIRQAENSNSKIRGMAGSVALACHERAPQLFEPIFMSLAADKEPSVPLEIMTQGLGDGEHDNRFMEKVLSRSNPSMSAAILAVLLNQSPRITAPWLLEMCKTCFVNGGELAIAVATYFSETKSESVKALDFSPQEPQQERRELVILAYLWALANSDSRKGIELPYDPTELLSRLTGPNRERALYYLSVQLEFLPTELREHVQLLKSSGGTDAAAISKGEAKRQSAGKNSRSNWGFPVESFLG